MLCLKPWFSAVGANMGFPLEIKPISVSVCTSLLQNLSTDAIRTSELSKIGLIKAAVQDAISISNLDKN